MAGRQPQVGPCQPRRAQKGPRQPRAPGALRAPAAEEEDPRVKCKDCGAFGHKASNLRCPMKRWVGALAPQPLGFPKMKENQKLCNPQGPRNQEADTSPAREREQRPSREDEQRQALLQRFPRRPLVRVQPCWKDQTESCSYVRHPHQPMPVHTTQRTCVGQPSLISRSPVRKPDLTSTVSFIRRAERSNLPPRDLSKGQGVPVSDSHHSAGPRFVQGPSSKPHDRGRALISQAQAVAHNSGQDSNVSHKAPGKRAAQSPAQTCQNPQKKPRLGPSPWPQKTTPRADPGCVQPVLPPASAPELRPALASQAPGKSPAQGQSVDLQPPHKGPVLRSVQSCRVSEQPPVPQGPLQPLRMVLTRLKRGQWSSRLLTTPSAPPAEKPAAPGQSPPSPGTSEPPGARVPASVLREELQVPSSSEDSDGQ